MTDTENEPRRLKSLQRATKLIETIEQLNGARLVDLTKHVDLSKGSIHTQLATLRDAGYITKRGDEYQLGLRFVTLGEYVKGTQRVYEAAKNQVDRLAAETGEYADLVVENEGLEVALKVARGKRAMETEYHISVEETPQYLHNSSAGKAILAHLPEDRVHEIIDKHGLNPRTPNTITDRDALFDQLAVIRERGYAVNDEEDIRGFRAVGAPILDIDSNPIGAISVSAPTSRLKGERFETEIPDRVMQATNVVEIDIDTSAHGRRTG
ncbi:IclR family transcriptional regulator [Haloferax elongans ATCC BAA-1513]|uniref:IclR family transcriptional regulator n=1 Tax=Haloferax elongans ATCC BAA-1513 TaxID=1230453 RepID=M0HLI4_HALEO|nr:IclR family transcriptional regulator [Haloferax elongans]ELZ84653.1 IclR family transcriptional regulator [Haloferax elongans ATCC BAA-1513]